MAARLQRRRRHVRDLLSERPPDLLASPNALRITLTAFNRRSFSAFPERLSHLLSTQTSSTVQTQVSSIVYPAYDTRGELVTAVDNHHQWLTNLVKENTTSFRKDKGEKGLVRVVLLGHSMVSPTRLACHERGECMRRRPRLPPHEC